MSTTAYLRIVEDVRLGHINPDLKPQYSGLRGVVQCSTPPAQIKQHNVPARVFAGSMPGFSAGATRKRRYVPAAKPIVSAGTTDKGISVFVVRKGR